MELLSQTSHFILKRFLCLDCLHKVFPMLFHLTIFLLNRIRSNLVPFLYILKRTFQFSHMSHQRQRRSMYLHRLLQRLNIFRVKKWLHHILSNIHFTKSNSRNALRQDSPTYLVERMSCLTNASNLFFLLIIVSELNFDIVKIMNSQRHGVKISYFWWKEWFSMIFGFGVDGGKFDFWYRVCIFGRMVMSLVVFVLCLGWEMKNLDSGIQWRFGGICEEDEVKMRKWSKEGVHGLENGRRERKHFFYLNGNDGVFWKREKWLNVFFLGQRAQSALTGVNLVVDLPVKSSSEMFWGWRV